MLCEGDASGSARCKGRGRVRGMDSARCRVLMERGGGAEGWIMEDGVTYHAHRGSEMCRLSGKGEWAKEGKNGRRKANHKSEGSEISREKAH